MKKLYTVSQAAEKAGVNRQTIYQHIWNRKLYSKVINHGYFIPEQSLIKWMRERAKGRRLKIER